MSIVSLVGNVLSWGVRGAVAGFAVDIGRSVFVKEFTPRNTLISSVHGLAIGVLGSVAGTGAAVGAFIASTFAILPALFFENVPGELDECILIGVKIRLVATLVGGAVGSIF